MKFQRVIEYIEKEIKSGRLSSGSKLPSIRILAEDLNCSKSTVNKAYDKLLENKLAYVIDKKGYYLMNEPENLLISDKVDFSKLHLDDMFLDQKTYQIIFNKIILDLESEDQDLEGLFSLRIALKKYFKERKIFTTVHDLFIMENIHQSYRSIFDILLKNGDGVLIENPTDPILIEALHGKSVFTFNRDGYNVDFTLLEYHLIKNNIKLLIITSNGHLPTGDSMSLEDRQKLLDYCYAYGVQILELNFIEDAYDFVENQSLYALDKEDIVIHLKSFNYVISKHLDLVAIIYPRHLSKLAKFYKAKYLGDTSLINQAILKYFIDHLYNSQKKVFLNYKDKNYKLFNTFFDTIDFPEGFEVFHGNDRLYTFIKVPFDFNLETMIKDLRAQNVVVGNIQSYFWGEHTFKGIILTSSNVKGESIEKGLLCIKNYILQEAL